MLPIRHTVAGMNPNQHSGAKEFLEAAFDEVKQFLGSAKLEDDITRVVIKIEE